MKDLEKVKELCVSSMYWEMHMRDALKELLEKNVYVQNGVNAYFGPRVLELMMKPMSVTFSEFFITASFVSATILGFDSSENKEHKALFNVFEDVNFYIGETVNTYERIMRLLELLGFEEEAQEIIDDIGADIGGYTTALE